jgi:hypothetical protein
MQMAHRAYAQGDSLPITRGALLANQSLTPPLASSDNGNLPRRRGR